MLSKRKTNNDSPSGLVAKLFGLFMIINIKTNSSIDFYVFQIQFN
jgi:hypothetical protein